MTRTPIKKKPTAAPTVVTRKATKRTLAVPIGALPPGTHAPGITIPTAPTGDPTVTTPVTTPTSATPIPIPTPSGRSPTPLISPRFRQSTCLGRFR